MWTKFSNKNETIKLNMESVPNEQSLSFFNYSNSNGLYKWS